MSARRKGGRVGLRGVATAAAVVAVGLWAVPAMAAPTTLLDRSVQGASVDGALGVGEYSGGFSEGINAGFGNMIGSATDLHVDADLSGGLWFALNGSQAACGNDDHIVIYIDSDETAGFASTAFLTDTGDLGRAAASGGSDPTLSSLTFATGFAADYAIVISNAAVSLFDLETGAHTYLGALDRTFSGSNCDQELGSATLLTDLGLTPGDDFDYVVTLLNATNGYRANEFHGVASTTVIPSSDGAGNPGTSPVVLEAGDFNTFESLSVLINEVDADTTGTDTMEFIELVTNHDQTDLTGLTVVLYNGSSDTSYEAFDLAANTGASIYYLLGNAAVVSTGLVFADNTLQNGADAVALYVDQPAATSFPNGTAVTDVGLVDAVVYDTDDGDDTGLLDVLTPGEPQLNEAANGDKDTEANQRCAGGARETTFWYAAVATPGSVNDCPACALDVDCGTCQVCDTTVSLCVQAAETTPCDDGNACSTASTCDAAGVCQATAFVLCDATNDTTCAQNTCNPSDGTCSLQPINEGGACDDGSLCTTGDTCTAGTCGGTAVDCSGSDTTCAQATCNPTDGTCTGVPLPINTGNPCDDGDTCTTGEVCAAGVCAGGTNTCDCFTTADCAGLEDGNACNGTLVCVANSCVVDPLTVVTCDPTNDTACMANICNPSDGTCAMQSANEGGACDDGDLCTNGSTCTAGTCAGGTPVTCDASNDTACQTNQCVPTTGICALQPVNEGGACDDGDACTGGETCTAGTCGGGTSTCMCVTDADCLGSEDGNLCNGTLICDQTTNTCQVDPLTVVTCDPTNDTACMANTCTPATGLCTMQAANEGGACDDGALCTTGDTCTAGVCAGTTLDCTAFDDACNVASCDATTGQCTVLTPTNEAGVCDDGDACTAGEVCTGGTCGGGTSVCACVTDADCGQFEDGDLCNGTLFCDQTTNTCEVDTATVVTCDPTNDTACMANTCNPTDGTCAMQAAGDGTTCDDGDLCTTGESCMAGACQGGTTPDCSSLDDSCNSGVCDPATGACAAVPVADDTPCDDGSACTLGDLCSAGVCGGDAVPDDQACDDGNDCTIDDVCTAGVCAGTPATGDVACGDACNAGMCDGNGQCTTSPVPDGTTCDDGDPCTDADQCTAGSCGGDALDCSGMDGVCMVGTCDTTSGGCTAVPATDGTACDDGDACTGGDQCVAGLCTAGSEMLCAEPGEDVAEGGDDVAEPGTDTSPDASGPDVPGADVDFNQALTGGGPDCDCRIQAGTGDSRRLPARGALVLLLAAGLLWLRRRRR